FVAAEAGLRQGPRDRGRQAPQAGRLKVLPARGLGGFPSFFPRPLDSLGDPGILLIVPHRARRFSGDRRRLLGLLFDKSASSSQSEGVSAVCRLTLAGSRQAGPPRGRPGAAASSLSRPKAASNSLGSPSGPRAAQVNSFEGFDPGSERTLAAW